MNSAFRSYHPIINFLYFFFVFVGSMFFMHPICIMISFLSGLSYSLTLRGIQSLKFYSLYVLPMAVFSIIIQVAFQHKGVTILMYFHNGNPFTLESILFAVASSMMIVSVIFWFSCYNEIITSDKLMFLFGKWIPSLSLIISMVLRFVPKLKEQIKEISKAQKYIGHDISKGTILQRIKNGTKIISILVTWALENGIETADSMKGRGYGLPNRTSFSIYCFDKRDKKALIFMIVLGLYVVIGVFCGRFYFRYYPYIKGVEFTPFSISVFLSYFLFCIWPTVIEKWEDRKWKKLELKI